MPFDPQKLFLGIMDLFTILMPGALLTFLLRDHVGEPVLGARYHDLSGSEAWALFLLVSYLVGHVVDSFRRVEWIPLREAIGRGSIGRGQVDPDRERALHPETIAMLQAAATTRGIALEDP